jgi:hypothetical protein
MFFDFVINSYSVSIKRVGAYCRVYLEPELRRLARWGSERLMWEEFMSHTAQRQNLAMIGNLGITVLASVPGAIVLLLGDPNWTSVLLFISMLIAFGFVAFSHLRQKKFIEMQRTGSDRAAALPL